MVCISVVYSKCLVSFYNWGDGEEDEVINIMVFVRFIFDWGNIV